jgi:proteasome assembly chaperone (PAC2) family protein
MEVAEKLCNRVGVINKGRIVGGTGLTLAIAKAHGLDGVSLLGTTTGLRLTKVQDFRFQVFNESIGKRDK